MAKAEYRSAVRSRKLINEALADLLMEKPLDKITVTDVVTRADINRGTFYAHYKDIPDVVDHLIQQTFDVIRDAMLSQTMTPVNAGLTLLTTIQTILEKDLTFYRKILNSGVASILCEQLMSIMIEFMLENEERFYPYNQEEYQIAVRFCAGGLSNLYQDWFSGKLSCSLSELTQIGYSLVLRIVEGEQSVLE